MTPTRSRRPRAAGLDEDPGLLPLVQAADSAIRDPATVAEIVALGTGLLRRAPLVVGVVLAVAAAAAALGDLPPRQGAWLLCALGAFEVSLLVGAWRAHAIPFGSSGELVRLLGQLPLIVAVVVSGGVLSPLSPLLLAPAVGRFAAGGLNRRTLVHGALLCALFCALALLPEGTPFSPLPSPFLEALALASLAACLALLFHGVAGLTDAYRGAGEELDHLREGLLSEAAGRERSREAVGAKVAHEIKNPLTSIKGLVQLLARRDDETAERFAAMAREVERVERVLTGYLSRSRPLEDLQPEPVSIRDLLTDVATLLEARVEASEASLAVESVDGAAWLEPRRLKEALVHLAEYMLLEAGHGGVLELSAATARDGLILTLECHPPLGLEPVRNRRGDRPSAPGDDELFLTLAHAVAAQHGGELEVLLTSGGLKAVLTLPSPLIEERKRDVPDPAGR